MTMTSGYVWLERGSSAGLLVTSGSDRGVSGHGRTGARPLGAPGAVSTLVYCLI
jgi:hypothetical protein